MRDDVSVELGNRPRGDLGRDALADSLVRSGTMEVGVDVLYEGPPQLSFRDYHDMVDAFPVHGSEEARADRVQIQRPRRDLHELNTRPLSDGGEAPAELFIVVPDEIPRSISERRRLPETRFAGRVVRRSSDPSGGSNSPGGLTSIDQPVKPRVCPTRPALSSPAHSVKKAQGGRTSIGSGYWLGTGSERRTRGRCHRRFIAGRNRGHAERGAASGGGRGGPPRHQHPHSAAASWSARHHLHTPRARCPARGSLRDAHEHADAADRDRGDPRLLCAQQLLAVLPSLLRDQPE